MLSISIMRAKPYLLKLIIRTMTKCIKMFVCLSVSLISARIISDKGRYCRDLLHCRWDLLGKMKYQESGVPFSKRKSLSFTMLHHFNFIARILVTFRILAAWLGFMSAWWVRQKVNPSFSLILAHPLRPLFWPFSPPIIVGRCFLQWFSFFHVWEPLYARLQVWWLITQDSVGICREWGFMCVCFKAKLTFWFLSLKEKQG